VEEGTARAVVEAHKAKGSPKGGQLAALDSKGKTIALWGEPGEEPPKPKPVASLPDVVARLELLEERVEMIEASDGQFTADEVKALKAMLAKPAPSLPAKPPTASPA
jgi:hypothetical protein